MSEKRLIKAITFELVLGEWADISDGGKTKVKH